MWRLGLLGLGLLMLAPEAQAQSWGWSYDRGYSNYRPQPQYRFFNWWDDDDDEGVYRPRARGPAQQSGGALRLPDPRGESSG